MNKVSSLVWRQRFSLLLGLSLLMGCGIGHAKVIGGSSEAYAIEADVTLGGPLGSSQISVDPTPFSSGSAPPPYNDSQQGDSLQAQGELLGIPLVSLTIGELEANAVSDIDGSLGDKYASANATVKNFVFDVLDGLLTLSVAQASSSATVSGDHGALGGFGTVTLDGAVISSYITDVPIILDSNPAPNTAVDLSPLGLGGIITLVLNEQKTDGDGINNYALTVNAIRLTLDVTDLGVLELPVPLNIITGEIIIAHSAASISAQQGPRGDAGPNPVAEPATLALMGLGFTALYWQARRKAAVSFA
ncbi:PEP-CTERM sorting domain-containing protein [Methylocaldum szegediense]|nr:PEP-CTERM sorting domain-containing protein [Methylocaldum szegediense]